MLPFILAAVGGYLIADSMKDKKSQKFEDGGYVDDDEVSQKMEYFNDRLYYAKKGIVNAYSDEDTDLAIEEYYKVRKEKDNYEKTISDRKDKARADRNVENIIEDEKEAAERIGYEYKKLYKKDPRLAAIKAAEDMIAFLMSGTIEEYQIENGSTPEEAKSYVEKSIIRRELDIADLKRNIKDNPILK